MIAKENRKKPNCLPTPGLKYSARKRENGSIMGEKTRKKLWNGFAI